jgi:hypothetical protein
MADGQCEHLFLRNNCPYCEILRLRREQLALHTQVLALTAQKRHLEAEVARLRWLTENT